MGYRSDVGIKCQEKAYRLFKEQIEKNDFRPDQILMEEIGDGFSQYTIIWEWVKWYEGFKEVDAIVEVMSDLDAYESNCGKQPCEDGYEYSFIRIGEDVGDIEVQRNGWEIEFYVHCSFPLAGEPVD